MTLRARVRFAVEALRAKRSLTRIERALAQKDLTEVCRDLGIACDLRSANPPATVPAVLPRNTRTPVIACQWAVARWSKGDTCLRRCLVIGHRLRHLYPILRIGVRRDGTAIVAHSWLEIDGFTLDPESSRYATLGRVR